jgi:malyl-CoA/(S)-citramalyl-CoA lyase
MGGPSPSYGVLTDATGEGGRSFHWGDLWHYALSRLVVAARANGLRPLDGPFGDIPDVDGFKAQANRAAVLGCDGKWAIHPSQIALANEVFTPPEVEVNQARRILKALAEAQAEGRGAVALDGRMIDLASIRQAEILVKKADEISGRAA